MYENEFGRNYWMDFTFLIIQSIEYRSSNRCSCIKRIPEQIKLLIRITMGFLIDILAIALTATIYGFDFRDEQGNLTESWTYICTLAYVVCWSCFAIFSIVLLITIVRDKVRGKWRCLIIFTISKWIGLINSGAIFYVILLYMSKAKFACLEGLFLTYATLDFLLNLSEIFFQFVVSCCYDKEVHLNIE